MKKQILLFFLLIPFLLPAQIEHTIMNYNLLNYPGNDTTTRNPYFRTTIAATLPDILVCQEMTSQAGVNGFLQNVLLPNYPGYAAGIFNDGPDTDNELFYKPEYFTFISNTPIHTALRDISEFTLTENSSGDTIRIYAVHLKASQGSDNELKRKQEVDSLRKVTNALSGNSFYLVMGDFNIYSSTEPAYTALLDAIIHGYFLDVLTLTGTWNNSAYAQYHTQSTRTRQFGGGANGGLDDRFDMILMSQGIIDTGGVHYVNNSYMVFGNDGQHYNDSINQPPNLVVSQEVANALHYSSDHLPVIATFEFNSVIPVELIAFNSETKNNEVSLSWKTSTEKNNRGFEIQRKNENEWNDLAFIPGSGTSTNENNYTFIDRNLNPGFYFYRLKQFDYDGNFRYSKIISVSIIQSDNFTLDQNYPNPFNPSTTIGYNIAQSGIVQLKVYNVLSEEIATLVNEFQSAGKHQC